MWDKARIAVLLQRDGHAVSESTTGRILKTLMERGAVTPVPSLRRNGPRAGGGRAHRARERWAAYFSSMTGKGSVVSVWADGLANGIPWLSAHSQLLPARSVPAWPNPYIARVGIVRSGVILRVAIVLIVVSDGITLPRMSDISVCIHIVMEMRLLENR